MNETQPEEQAEERPEARPEAVPEPPETPHPPARRRRRRLKTIAGCAVLLAALLGGTGYTVITVRDADRDPGAAVWKLPEAPAGKQRPADATGLRGMLLPYGGSTGYGRGPDIAEFGADAELSGAQATALRKESLRSLPRTQRRQLEKEIDKQHIKGMAMRSYISTMSAPDSTKDTFTAEIVLSQMESRQTVRSIAALQQEFLDALKVFRAGPKIEGHEHAKCFLPPASSKDGLDVMFCSAYEGNVLVSATMDAARPLDKKGAAQLLRDELDRIEDPGKAV